MDGCTPEPFATSSRCSSPLPRPPPLRRPRPSRRNPPGVPSTGPSPSSPATGRRLPFPPPPPPPPPPPRTSEPVLALIAKAAAAQGTSRFVGKEAVTRFVAVFDPVTLRLEGGSSGQTWSTEAFSLPPAGKTESLLRSAWTAEGKMTTVGHDGRSAWIRVGKEPARRFLDPEGKDAQDVRDVDQRRRMLRMALRVFFLGNLVEGPVVREAPEQEIRLPVGSGGEPRTVKCRVLDRAADPASGEPPIRIYLDAGSLLPVATLLFAESAERASTLLTFDYDAEDPRPKGDIPAGVKVPIWCELFELPVEPGKPPVLRIQAGVKKLVIDPAEVPDSLFEFPG